MQRADSCDVRRVRHWTARLATAILLGVSVAILPVFGQNAFALTCLAGYDYGGYWLKNYANEGIQGFIRGGGVSVANSNTQHALLFFASVSEGDPNTIYNGKEEADFVEGGFGRGYVDQKVATTYSVYGEAQDYNNPQAVVNWYPSLNYGNQYFDVQWSGTTASYDGYSRGLYKAWQNSDFLGEAWEIRPASTEIEALAEGWQSASSTCPHFDHAMFGTDGNYTNPSTGAAYDLKIYNDNEVWLPWTAAFDTTGEFTGSNYGDFGINQILDYWYAWDVYGG